VIYREGEAGSQFTPDDVVAVVVGDANWPEPVPQTDWVFDPLEGEWGRVSPPVRLNG
jgi:hypothetical protein